ncbi:SDR family NAD(P)-dependent oxidoreductase [Streptomyces purpurogeneiscleroticus]|uniref:SDR family NAD(P)-dependent oxidoreductase n=1 Tax=Streptomyces purpurogeneiscleroticus TaxID=68259 RepID=UPI001CBFB2CD|nr:SDR family oxidoreductase [Streptomyces purpurogeneiscleroticus]MBZ4016930.1 3-oxoacyl-ACP reductase [Streptomyces purpurogeneiscleroticus]
MARNVLVTGGGTGIGYAIAQHFAEQGETVFVTGRRTGPLKEAADRIGARAVVCDHTDPEALARLLTELPESIDVLVNNAGGNTDFDTGAASDLASYARDFRANLDANLVSAALTTKALEERLATDGAVVHIGSIAGNRGGGSYGAAKAGLATWNIDLAGALGARGITANVVAPGYIADTEFFRDRLTDERRTQLVTETAVGRPGSPTDVADAVAFLASPAARHITGQVLHVNGGAHPTR